MTKRAKGSVTPEGARKIAITFEPELFKLIAEEAVKNDRTFAAQVRIWMKKGMQQCAPTP